MSTEDLFFLPDEDAPHLPGHPGGSIFSANAGSIFGANQHTFVTKSFSSHSLSNMIEGTDKLTFRLVLFSVYA